MRRIILLCVLLLLAAAGTASAKDALFEAESYENSHNIAFQSFITVNEWLQGLDYPGEWLAYTLEPDGYGTAMPMLYLMGNENIDYHIQVILTPTDFVGRQTVDVFFRGAGCSG